MVVKNIGDIRSAFSWKIKKTSAASLIIYTSIKLSKTKSHCILFNCKDPKPMKTTLIRYLFIFIFLSTIFQACKKKGPVEPEQHGDPFDIHAAGRIGYVATYWKNGKPSTIGKSNSNAVAMAVSGNDIHLAGFEMNAAGKHVAKYWKNGVGISLTDGTVDAFANGIFISGNDVYIAGQELLPGRSTYQAKYWKNGTPVNLTGDNQQAIATDIAVVAGDVYVIGERRNLDWLTTITCYWKNGQLFDLGSRSTTASDQSLTVSGNDVYMLWSEVYNNFGQLQTRYSKNLGSAIPLNDGSPDVRGSAITVNGNDVYIAGTGTAASNQGIVAKYWKNGSSVALSDGTVSAYGLSIAVAGNDVFVGGYSDGGIAQYWKNGTLYTITDGKQESMVQKIIVVKK